MNQPIFFIVNAEGKYLNSNGQFASDDPLLAAWFFSRPLALRFAELRGATLATYDPDTKQIIQPQP